MTKVVTRQENRSEKAISIYSVGQGVKKLCMKFVISTSILKVSLNSLIYLTILLTNIQHQQAHSINRQSTC